MFFGVSHLDVPVTDLARAEKFWGACIGLQKVKQGEGFVDMDSGSITLRFVQVGQVSRPVTIRVSVADVAQAFQRLADAGGRALYEMQRTPALELEAHVADPDGNIVVVWRALSEDEYGFIPELPKQGEWLKESETLLNALLQHVPALFRGMARNKVTKIIEEVAGYDASPVTREHVIRGYILASAKIKRDRLIEPLKACGINPADYPEEFDA